MHTQCARTAPSVITETGCIAAGGLVSAVTAPVPNEASAWAVAYLVLVCGLAQVLLGSGRVLLSSTSPSWRSIAAECMGWNVANAAILVGNLADVASLLYLGAVLLLVDIGLLLHGVRRNAGTTRWPLYTYRVLAALLAVSVPVGLLLARMRPD